MSSRITIRHELLRAARCADSPSASATTRVAGALERQAENLPDGRTVVDDHHGAAGRPVDLAVHAALVMRVAVAVVAGQRRRRKRRRAGATAAGGGTGMATAPPRRSAARAARALARPPPPSPEPVPASLSRAPAARTPSRASTARSPSRASPRALPRAHRKRSRPWRLPRPASAARGRHGVENRVDLLDRRSAGAGWSPRPPRSGRTHRAGAR